MPASDWLDPPVVAYLIARYGGTREAEVAAMQLPGWAEEITRQTGARLETADDGRPYVKLPFRDRERAFHKLVEAAVGLKTGDQASDSGPSPIPEAIVERAVQLHAEKGAGRRALDRMVPGLTVYQAGQVLGWFRVGKPAGLWLEDGRLKWGRAISATPAGLRLPRL
jgi:hypothetical protein